jgi:hypothetical protein
MDDGNNSTPEDENATEENWYVEEYRYHPI